MNIDQKLRRKLINPLPFRLFLLGKLPMGFLSGMRIKAIDQNECVVAIRYRFLVKNPFNSMFWAVMGMGSEMSTGALLLLLAESHSDEIRFILIRNEASYNKKARGVIRFTCNQGEEIATLFNSLDHGDSEEITLKSTAKNEAGEEISSSAYTWMISKK